MRGTFFMGSDAGPKFEVKEMELPPLGEHEVLMRNRACGVCGTDIHIYHGEAGSAEVTSPIVLGMNVNEDLQSMQSVRICYVLK